MIAAPSLHNRVVHALAEIAFALRFCYPAFAKPTFDFIFRLIGCKTDCEIRRSSKLPISFAGNIINKRGGLSGFYENVTRCLDENNNVRFGHS